jgi:hypothetical protein
VERRHGEQPDRAEADDDSGGTRMKASALNAMYGDRERLDQARWRFTAGTATRSAKPPSRANPMPAVSAIAQR